MTSASAAEAGSPCWWKEGVVYQVYPRSFMDSDGDGIGDLQGVIDRLDYLQSLGITILWLTPFNPSPHIDNGYDIANHYGVDARYGSLADADRLIAECHARGMRLIMDVVLNFTSDQHPWFIESRASRDNPRRDYYFWRPGKPDGSEPNNWSSGFSPSAWELDPVTGEYYLHYYAAQMPDLNWENREMRTELYAMLRWWLDRGVDGLRLDSINLIKKNTDFPDARTPDPLAPGYFYDIDLIYNQPGILSLFQEMHREVFDHRDIMTVGETSVTSAEVALEFVKPANRAFDMVFNFEPVELEGLELPQLKEINRRWYRIIEQGGWTSQYLSNHDQPRQVSKFGNDREWREASAKALALMLHTLPGTPFIFQGEEIGMTNCAFDRIEDYDDIAAHNRYRGLIAGGTSAANALATLQKVSRDNARTPMQWSALPQAGFTSGMPWLPVNPNHTRINVQAALDDPGSVLHFYRRLIALRKANPVLVYGSFVDHLPEHASLYVYSRRIRQVEWRVLLNLSSEIVSATLPVATTGTLLLGNQATAPMLEGHQVTLRPWEAAVVAVDR